MRNCSFDVRRMVAILASVIILLLGIPPGSFSGRAFAQETGLSQMQSDAHNASFMAGRIEKRVREVRTLAYVTLGLTAIGFGLGGYLLLWPETGRFRSPPGAVVGPVADVLLRWWRDNTLRRLRRRQRHLAQAIAELQDFADLASRRNQEMAVLLAAVKTRMEQLDEAIQKQPTLIS